jgi:hypothetical protein
MKMKMTRTNETWATHSKSRSCGLFFDGGIMGLRPTQGDEKRLLFSDYWSLEAPPSPLSSRPKWRDLRFNGPYLEMFSTVEGKMAKLIN